MFRITPPPMALDRLRHWRHALAVVALVMLTCLIYRSALQHTPRDDQWSFLIETMGEDRFLPLLAHTYSFNRTRTINPGDYPLFRPMLFALLSAEKALFGHRFVWWQAAGIAFHLVNACLFLAILLRIHRRQLGTAALDQDGERRRTFLEALAYAFTCFFAVNFAVSEMVMWHHIHGYLLFVALALGSILMVIDLLAGITRWRVITLYVLVLLAAFTYEVGQFFAFVVGLATAWIALRQGRPRLAMVLMVLFTSVLGLYQLADRIDRRAHADAKRDIDLGTILAAAPSTNTLNHAQRYLIYGTMQPFFPGCATWMFNGGRLDIAEPRDILRKYCRLNPLLVISYLVVGAMFVLTFGSLRTLGAERFRAAILPVAILPVALIGLHMMVIVLGRSNLRPLPGTFSGNSYYAYLPLLMLLLAIYCICTTAPVPGRQRLLAGVSTALLMGLAVLTGASAWKTREISSYVKDVLRPIRCAVKDLDAIIDRGRSKPGFRISFDPEYLAGFETPCGVPLPHILFREHVDDAHPTHIIVKCHGKLQAVPIEAYRRAP